MNFVTGLPLSVDWNSNSDDSILLIVDCLTKMMHYELVKVTTDTLDLAELIIDVVVRHHGLSDSIISDRGAIFMFKFGSSLYYFLGIKQQLSTVFYPLIDG